MDYKEFINTTLINASKIANSYFGKVSSISTKSNDNNQVLTEADLAIGKYIVEEIRNTFSVHNVIDEEAGIIDNNSQYTWVVDPIDGTSNFANGLPTYGIMIGLLKDHDPIAGGVSLPFFDEIYLAQKGYGATCNSNKITVSKETNLLKALVSYGIDGHQENPDITYEEIKVLAEIILNIRNLRTTNSAYDMVQVASGKYGAYINKTTKLWDNVAIQPIIEESGGVVTDYWGKPIDYSNPLSKVNQNFTICAGAPMLHKSIVDITKKFYLNRNSRV